MSTPEELGEKLLCLARKLPEQLPSIKYVRELIDKKASMTSVTTKGYTALCLAAAFDQLDFSRILIDGGSDVNHKGNLSAPIHFAAKGGHVDMCHLLLNRKSRISLLDREDWSALHYGALNGRRGVCELLLDRDPDLLELRNNNGDTALQVCVKNGHLREVRFLLERGADVESRNDSDVTPLIHAAAHGHETVVAHLLLRGANISAVDQYGCTALHQAAQEGKQLYVLCYSCAVATVWPSIMMAIHALILREPRDTLRRSLSWKSCKVSRHPRRYNL